MSKPSRLRRVFPVLTFVLGLAIGSGAVFLGDPTCNPEPEASE